MRGPRFFLHLVWAVANSLPMAVKIMGMVLGTALLIGVITIYQVRRVTTQETYAQMRDKSCTIAREFASSSTESILWNDLFGLTRSMKEAVDIRPDLRYLFILSPHNEVIAHTFNGGFPLDLLEVDGKKPPAPGGGTGKAVLIQTNEGQVWDCPAPILNGELGVVRAGVSLARSKNVIDSLVLSIISAIVAVAILGLIMSAFLTWVLTRPVQSLVRATKAIRQGDYSVRLEKATPDEIGELVMAFNDMAAQMERAEEERMDKEALRREYLHKIITVQEEERRRIARELHDQVGQALASLRLDLRLIETAPDQTSLRQRIERFRNTVGHEMESIHAMALALRPPVLDDMGLVPALEQQIDSLREQHGLSIDFLHFGLEEVRLDTALETAVYRILQEALTNVIRHSGASNVTVLLEVTHGEIRGVIEDDGQGFDGSASKADRVGIYGMVERATLLGGSLVLESEPGEGVMVAFNIPITETADG